LTCVPRVIGSAAPNRSPAVVNDAGALQKKNTDLRLKYFGIYSKKLNGKAAARFALIDDYVTTAIRLNLLEQVPLPGEEADK
jgi:hypothetical protein